MRVVSLGLLVLVFVLLPFYALNTHVLPQLEALQEIYASADAIAETIAAGE